jgi:hypothetical protein
MSDLVGTAAKLGGLKAEKLRILKRRKQFVLKMKTLWTETFGG